MLLIICFQIYDYMKLELVTILRKKFRKIKTQILIRPSKVRRINKNYVERVWYCTGLFSFNSVFIILEILHKNGGDVYLQNLSINTPTQDKQVSSIASILLTIMAEMSNIERQNIQYRLNSGRATYIANGSKLGRKKGSTKTTEQKKQEYSEIISLLKCGYSVRNTAKLTGFGFTTVQRVKTEFGI